MKIVNIDKKDWAAGLEKARSAYRLYGPVHEKGHEFSSFKELAAGETPDMKANNTRLSPKSVAFPPSEVMFEYSAGGSEDGNSLKRPEKDMTPKAVVGIRPYDAAAFLVVRKNFDTPEYRDPYWCDDYETCVFIGLAVNEPDSLDFSTSANSGPFDESGLDVLLVDMGGHYLAKEITEKGGAFLKTCGFQSEADADKALQEIEKLKKAAEEKIVSKISFDKIEKQSIMDLYEADFWDDVSFACINCGTCTFVCPTCWCFDIQDETQGNCGVRQKNWDSCMFPLFTLHGSGHNPREPKLMRVRQRFMHKLKYFLDKYEDGIMCVGCGRCIRYCPVNIDIRKVCRLMNDNKPA